jgi:segregation and condensation protein B
MSDWHEVSNPSDADRPGFPPPADAADLGDAVEGIEVVEPDDAIELTDRPEPIEVAESIDAIEPAEVVEEVEPGAPVVDPLGAVDTDEVIGEIESAERLRDATKRAIEALVLVAEEPLASNLLGQLLEVSPVIVDRMCEELASAYEDEGRGFQLVRVAGGWRYQSHPDQAAYVERFVLQGQTGKLSAAALETLAIVAYKQPISRAQVASIRGVSVDGVMRTLEQRGYIAEIGKDPGPGQAILFGTTSSFLEKLGLDDIDELPPLGDFVPGADVVEQLERGLRPDRMPLRPEDAMMPGDIAPASVTGDGEDGEGDDDGEGSFDRPAGFDDVAPFGLPEGLDLPEGLELPEGLDLRERNGGFGAEPGGASDDDLDLDDLHDDRDDG